MKDVGLDDLDGYNNATAMADASGTGSSTIATAVDNSVNSNGGVIQNTTTIISSQGQAIMTTPLALPSSAGNQIVAQLQPQIQVQVIFF